MALQTFLLLRLSEITGIPGLLCEHPHSLRLKSKCRIFFCCGKEVIICSRRENKLFEAKENYAQLQMRVYDTGKNQHVHAL